MNKREFIGGAALCAAVGLWICGAFAATGAARAEKSPDQLFPLIVNEPAEHFFVAVADRLELETDGKRNEFADLWDFRLPKEVDLSERGVERYVDALAGGNLTHYFINVNYQRSFFPSKTIEPIWTSLDEPGRQQQKFVRNLKAAFGRGLDVYAVMIRRCRERGVSPWLSFRMNDIHGTQQKTDPMVSAFWKEHPEWHIGNDAGWENGLDYAQKPVRDRMVAFIREALERYDADGVELDFIRFPYYFRKGTERTNAPILTAFLREIRALCDAAAKRRGHPVKIAARFLPNPAQAVGMGADVGVWSKEGLLDLAIACNMYGSIEYEYHVDAWRKVLTDKTQFITGTDNGIVVNGKRRILNQGEYRDWITKMRKDGADGLYFFNFPIRPYRDEAWRSVLGAGASQENGMPSVVLDLPPSGTNCRNSEGDFVRLKDGRILFVYSHFTKGTGADGDPAYLASRESSDGGRTWTTNSLTVVANEAGQNVMSVSLLRLGNGAIALFYGVKNSDTDCRPVMRLSTDEAKTWGPPILCVGEADKAYYVLNNCRVHELANGRLVLPLCKHEAIKDGNDWHGKLVCYLSDDSGRTWRRNRAEPFATVDEKGTRVYTQEPGLVTLKDGRVLMYARTDRGRQWACTSSDNCETWTKCEPWTLCGPCSPATVKRLRNGDLLAVWNDHERHPERAKKGPAWAHGVRTPMTLAVSKDDGRTWPIRKTLADDVKGWYCYTAVLELEDRLLLGYCALQHLCETHVTSVPLSWLYASETFDNPVIREDFPDPTFWQGDDGWYYGTATGLKTIRRSRDLVSWEDTHVAPIAGEELVELQKFSRHFWAPDAVRVGRTYHLYFTQFVSSDVNRLVCATSERPEGPFHVRSIVLESVRHGKKDCAIDAEVVPEGGKLWLFTGSVAGGVWRTRLTADGLKVDPSVPLEHVAGLIPNREYRPWIYSHHCYEGSYVYRRGNWWYLFVSCGAIDDGSYRLFVGRSDRIDGVFRDRLGVPLTESGGEPILVTNPDSDFSGSGHNGDVFTDKTGRTYMFVHSQWKGSPCDRKHWRSGPRCTSLQELKWSADGWPYFETRSLLARERKPVVVR